MGTSILVLLTCMLVGACDEEGMVQVSKIGFEGVRSVPEGALRNALATRQSSWIPWGRKRYFDRAQLDADLRRIRAFYADRGYPDARVTGFDVQLNDEQSQVDVTLTIDEGEPVRIAAIDFYGFWEVPEEAMEAIRSGLPFKVGDVRNRPMMVASERAVETSLHDRGFAYSRAWITEEETAPRALAISITADPGPVVHFGLIEINGNESVGRDVIERELTFKSGDLFSRRALQDTQRRLYNLELFQFATVAAVDADRQYPEIMTRVTVAEGRHQRVNFGIGYGTEEKGRVDGEYRHVNFLGGARSASVQGRWSSLDRGIRTGFRQPYFLLRGYALNMEGQRWSTFTPAYTAVVSGGRATFEHRSQSQRRSWSMSFIGERNSSVVSDEVLADAELRNHLIALGLDPRTGKQEGILNAVAADVRIDGTDNFLDARRGFQVAGHLEQAGRVVGGTFRYYAASGDVRHYLPVGDRLTIANRLALGVIDGDGDEDVTIPFGKRLFLGGATSVRGWGRYEISPLVSGLPIGGDSMLAVSSELRFDLTEKVEAVAFLDAGNVWAAPWHFDVGDLRYAVGPGLRYATPIGPIRVDAGVQVNPIPDLLVEGQPQRRRWRLHFSIGQAF